ncbi:unnamed protein product [Brassica oleracea var. botrytis]
MVELPTKRIDHNSRHLRFNNEKEQRLLQLRSRNRDNHRSAKKNLRLPEKNKRNN